MKFHIGDTQTLGAIVRNLVATATWRRWLLHPYQMFIRSIQKTDRKVDLLNTELVQAPPKSVKLRGQRGEEEKYDEGQRKSVG